ncbi:hypothetical protein THASP1DRAFT_28623 [Thamnocephalis sphaerospora]|uniref:SET domain-containing protein n=1 Tax=Thamnocephalis sphaerospora TaxID=78915 RepID=A0A4P9XW06_9FUNG|nr:hypothetical protein THASP1DRAFT_28623 [Thamnocephalis sphaerospora]|eukprot:RKP09590.1 hypothetical protein THASP1DRAFT_28623 [Thamnocephalis sphaerospora]
MTRGNAKKGKQQQQQQQQQQAGKKHKERKKNKAEQFAPYAPVSSAAGAALPKNWPMPPAVFLAACTYVPASLRTLDVRLPAQAGIQEAGALLACTTRTCASVRIRGLTELGLTTHPAYPQRGLFAARDLPPRQLVLEYRGLVTLREAASSTSDYVLGFGDRLAIDADQCGNEARFVNDYRGVAARPNVEFREFIVGPISASNAASSSATEDASPTAEKQLPTAPTVPAHCVRMGVWTLDQPVKRGQELLVNYGKGYWRSRGLLRETVS